MDNPLEGMEHKVIALLMNKLGITEISFTTADIDALPKNSAVVTHVHMHSLDLKLMSNDEAMLYAAMQQAQGAHRV